ADLDAEVALCLLQADVREVVEPAVVQAADVGDQADLERRARGRRGGRRGRRRRGSVLGGAATGGDDREAEDEQEADDLLHSDLRGFRLWDENHGRFYFPCGRRRGGSRFRGSARG